jgi:hypothetical protein
MASDAVVPVAGAGTRSSRAVVREFVQRGARVDLEAFKPVYQINP